MASEEEIARRALDYQARAVDYFPPDMPGYAEWSARKMEEGYEVHIMYLDSIAHHMLPEELKDITEADFEAWLNDLRLTIGDIR